MIENNEQREWQIGYYDKNNDKITTFIVKEKDGAKTYNILFNNIKKIRENSTTTSQ